MSSNPAAPLDCKIRRLVMSTIGSSLACAAYDAAALLVCLKSTLRSHEGKARGAAFRAIGAGVWRRPYLG